MDGLRRAIESYLRRYPNEVERLSRLTDLVAQCPSDDQLISRKNFAGHVTASGFVISRETRRVLVIHHRSLQIFVQPGGHVDAGESPLEAARREIAEETGLVRLTYVPFDADPSIPIDIDSHAIPANAKKQEPGHWHHDFRFLFFHDGADDATEAQAEEICACHWFDLAQLADTGHFEFVLEKLAPFAV